MDTDEIINNEFKIIKKIGSGSFGDVYKGISLKNNNFVAIKIEKTDKKNSRCESEYNIYNKLQGKGFPKIYYFNNEQKILIMEYLGPCLQDLFDFCGKKFSIKTIAMIAVQILNLLENTHNKHIIHRDIKPENLLIGIGKKKSDIYLIDFGLSKNYYDNKKHIDFKNNKSFTGTYRYASIRNHRGIEQSRRDDLESVGYMLVYFYKGCLPWQGIRVDDKKTRNKNIYNIKRTSSIDDLTKDMPEEFSKYIRYCRLLRFSEVPDYTYLKGLFYNILIRSNQKLDYLYDWNILAKKKRAGNKQQQKQNVYV